MSRDVDRSTSKSELSKLEAAELGEALAHAYAPGELDAQLNERLIRLALEDPLAPPTEQELVESERLRRALDGDADHEDLDLIAALGSAHRFERPSQRQTNQLVERAAHAALKKAPAKQGTVIYATFAGVLAAAAAVGLLLQAPAQESVSKSMQAPAAAPARSPLELSRSSEDLFKKKFDRGLTSQRIDLIASARARDLRANRFSQWGVR